MAKTRSKAKASKQNWLTKVPLSTYIILGLALFIGFGFYWWRVVYSDPQRVFDAMISNSLQLNGVTRTVTQDGQDGTMKQVSRLNIDAHPAVSSLTTITQGEDTTVTTETIATPWTDYVRYTSIDTDQKTAEGKDIDFSSIVGVWGSQETLESGDLTDGQLYNELVVGVVPFGKLSGQQRRELLNFIQQEKVYEVDYALVDKEVVNGRPTYTYKVGVDAEAYVRLIQKFGEFTGLNNLQELDPSAYAASERLEFTLIVDVWSRQLVGVSNVGSDRTEVFSAHNASRAVEVPKDVITVEELQTRLQSVQ